MGSTAKSSALPNARSGIGSGVNPSAAPGSDSTFAVAAPTLELPRAAVRFGGLARSSLQLDPDADTGDDIDQQRANDRNEV